MRTPAPSQTQELIAALWQRNRPQMLDRLALLDRAAAAAVRRALPNHLRAEAADIAHKLAGSLGMFGFHEGTRLARELEKHLEQPSASPEILHALTAHLRRSLFPSDSGTFRIAQN